MEPITAVRHYWNHDYIHPGGVASVGDALVVSQFKRSTPDMPIRFDPTYYKRQKKNGSDVTSEPFVKSGGAFRGKRGFRISHGWYYQDKRTPDTTAEPTLASLGDYSWRNKVATVVNAKVTGERFLPLPGPFVLPEGAVPRGGRTPVVTGWIGGSDSIQNDGDDSNKPKPSTGKAAESGVQSVVTNAIRGKFPVPVIQKKSYLIA